MIGTVVCPKNVPILKSPSERGGRARGGIAAGEYAVKCARGRQAWTAAGWRAPLTSARFLRPSALPVKKEAPLAFALGFPLIACYSRQLFI